MLRCATGIKSDGVLFSELGILGSLAFGSFLSFNGFLTCKVSSKMMSGQLDKQCKCWEFMPTKWLQDAQWLGSVVTIPSHPTTRASRTREMDGINLLFVMIAHMRAWPEMLREEFPSDWRWSWMSFSGIHPWITETREWYGKLRIQLILIFEFV